LKRQLYSLVPVFALIAAVQGCASQEKISVVEAGPIKIQSAPINAILQDPTSWSGTVKAISVDGHNDIANTVNDALRASGYSVPDGDARVTYSITELYAGPAADYVEKSSTTGASIVKTGLSVATSVAVCATLRSCGSSTMVANEVTRGMNTASVSLDNGKGQNVQQLSGVSLVVHKVCISGLGACASTAAASADPSVTIAQLRDANAQQGLLRSIRLKK